MKKPFISWISCLLIPAIFSADVGQARVSFSISDTKAPAVSPAQVCRTQALDLMSVFVRWGLWTRTPVYGGNLTAQGKVIIITGATSGLGEALAWKFAEKGGSVVVTGREEEPLRTVVDNLIAQGYAATGIVCDVTSQDSVKLAVRHADKTFGGIDIAIFNAGIAIKGRRNEISDEQFNKVFDVNVRGSLRFLFETYNYLMARGGHAVVIGSPLAYLEDKVHYSYSATKRMLREDLNFLRAWFEHDGIAFQYVAPGFFSSRLRQRDPDGRFNPAIADPIPSRWMMSLDEAAEEIAMGILSRQEEIILPGYARFMVQASRVIPRTAQFLLDVTLKMIRAEAALRRSFINPEVGWGAPKPAQPVTTKINRVVMCAWGTWGDLAGMAEIAEYLQLAGLDVVFLTNAYFENQIKVRNIPFVGVLAEKDYLAVIHHPRLFAKGLKGLKISLNLIKKGIEPVYEWITTNTDPADTLLFINGFPSGAVLASEYRKYALVVNDVGASWLWSVDNPPGNSILSMSWFPPFARAWVYEFINWYLIDARLGPTLHSLRKKLGLPGQVTGILTDYLRMAHLRIGLWPSWWAESQKDWPAIEPTGFPVEEPVKQLPPGLDEFTRQPYIIVTAGSGNQTCAVYFRSALEAVRQRHLRSVFIGPDDQMPSGLPASVFHTHWVPAFGTLCARADLIFHPAAIGTSAFALKTGTRQLVGPLSFDQIDNANRLVKLGVAHRLKESAYREGLLERIVVLLAKQKFLKLFRPSFLAYIRRQDRWRGRLIAQALENLLSDDSLAANCAAVQRKIENEPPGGPTAARRIYQFIHELESRHQALNMSA